MIHPTTTNQLISETTTGSGSTTRDFTIQGSAFQLALVTPSIVSGSVSLEVRAVVGGEYLDDPVLSLGPISVASSNPVIVSSVTSWPTLRLIVTYTGVATYQVHVQAMETSDTVNLAAGTAVDLVPGATVDLAPGAEVDLAAGAEVDLAAGAEVIVKPDQLSLISTLNIFNSTLNTATSYTGTWEDITLYQDIATMTYSTRDVTLYLEFSMDGVNTHRTLTYSVPAGIGKPHKASRVARYFRTRISNTSGLTATIQHQVIYNANTKGHLSTPVDGNIDASADSEVTRSILFGRTEGGIYQNLPVDSSGHLQVAIHSPVGPFGSVHTESLRPIFQIDGVYGVPEFEARTNVSGSGVASASNSLLTVSTGTTINSTAAIQSRKRLRYRPGQGTAMRFTSLFTTPVANSYQVMGMGHSEDGYYFAYKDTTFGILYNHHGVREIQTLTVTVASTTTENITVTLAGVAHAVAVTNSASTLRTAYEISLGTYAGWQAEQIGSTVVFVARDAGNKVGTFSITATTAVGTFAETKAGVTPTEVFIPQTDWNVDKMNGAGPSGVTHNPQKFNVYQINMAYLGAGPVSFYIMTSRSGMNASWNLVHVIQHPNTLTQSHVSNPSMPFTMAVDSAGSTTNLTVSSASIAGFMEGQKYTTGPRVSYTNTITTVTAAAFHALFTVRNGYVFGGRANQSVISLLSIAAAAKHTQPVVIYLFRDATLAGNPNFTPYSTGSCADYDSSATTCTVNLNRQLLWSGMIGETGEMVITFSDDILIQPGETITAAARATTGTPAYVSISLNTREDQ
jgi:hypothetical protein